MNLFRVGASGMQAAQLAIATTGQNIANANTPDYKKQYATTNSVDSSVLKRYLPGGTTATVVTASDPLQERIVATAQGAAAFDSAWKDGIQQVNDIISTPSVESTFSNFMNATQDLTFNPQDSIRQSSWKNAGEAFSTQLKTLSDKFDLVTRQITETRDIQQTALDGLQQAMSQITSGPPTEAAKAALSSMQSQVLMLSKTIEGYNKVLNGVLPPIYSMYTSAQKAVIDGINKSYGQDIINDQGNFSFDPSNMGDVASLSEFGSQKFNRDMGALNIEMGSKLNQISMVHDAAQNDLRTALSNLHKTTGVDMTEEAVKLLQFQRMYEANAKVLQVGDTLLGTLLNIGA